MLMRILLSLVVVPMMSGCHLTAEDHGSPIVKAEIPITISDIPKIVSASEAFSMEAGLQFNYGEGTHGFAIDLKRERFSIAAYNTVQPGIVYVRAWDKGARAPENIEAAKRYVDLVRSVAGAS